MARESGGSTNGKSSTSLGPRATPMAVICRMTAARLVRRISGSVNCGRDSKSSSEYSRIAMPSETRPQRPERWLAEAWETRSIGQPLDLGAVRVPGDAGRAGVDDVLDAGHRQGGLGDVGGQDDPAFAAGVEDLVLLLQAEPGEQRQHFGAGEPPVGLDPCVEGLGGVADLALAGEENEDVARGLPARVRRRRRRRRRAGRGPPQARRRRLRLHRRRLRRRPAGRAGGSGSRPDRCGRKPR